MQATNTILHGAWHGIQNLYKCLMDVLVDYNLAISYEATMLVASYL